MNDIVMSPFCRSRQTKDSSRSHFEGTEEDLLRRVRTAFHQGDILNGYRMGVIKALIENTDGFFTPVVELKEGDKGSWEYVCRQAGEEPRIEMFMEGGQKMPAKRVEVILYSHDTLAENGEESCSAAWEIVAINASPYEEEEPMKPSVLMANHFQISGGTATGMDDHQFVEALKKSFLYWRGKSNIRPRG